MKSTVIRCSHRLVGEQTQEWHDTPSLTLILDLLAKVYNGQVELLELYTHDGKNMMLLGKPGLAHICLFFSDTEEYIFDNGTGDPAKIDVGGDYWPSFQICRDQLRAENITKEFYVSGLALPEQKWIHHV